MIASQNPVREYISKKTKATVCTCVFLFRFPFLCLFVHVGAERSFTVLILALDVVIYGVPDVL